MGVKKLYSAEIIEKRETGRYCIKFCTLATDFVHFICVTNENKRIFAAKYKIHSPSEKGIIMSKLFIGREKEQQLLKEYINSDQSEFIAVYGRRRVGKTFLIQQVIGNDYAFYAAGMNKVSMRIQLKNFMQGMRKNRPETPLATSWLDAFLALENVS